MTHFRNSARPSCAANVMSATPRELGGRFVVDDVVTVTSVARAATIALLLMGFAQSTARAAEPLPLLSAEPTPRRSPLGIAVSAGFRSDLVRSAGLDPFSTTDAVPQSALAVSYGWSLRPRFGMALGVEWNHGEAAASARGAETTLTLDRLSVGIEGRWSLGTRWMLFGRLAPGLLRDKALLIDSSAPPAAYGSTAPPGLRQTSWSIAGDASAGLALRLTDVHPNSGPVVSVWLLAEGGYGAAAPHDLVLVPGVETQPGREDGPVRLGRLAYGGPFARFRLALLF